MGIQSISAQLNAKGICTSVYYYRAYDVEELEPDENVKIIGFSTFSTNYEFINEVIRHLKQRRKDIIVVVGGHFVSNNPDIFTLMPEIDYVVNGEGEVTSVDLFSRLLGYTEEDLFSIEGIAYRAGEQIIWNANRKSICDLDSLKWPDRTLLKDGECQEAMIESARGCTGSCSFCSARRTKWRAKSVQNVADEMEHIIKKYNVDTFSFTDSSFDNPNLNISRIKKFCQEVISRKLNSKFMIYLKTQIYKIDDNQMWDMLIRAGLSTVLVGTETFNEQDIAIYRKSATVQENILCIKKLLEMDFQLILGFINLHPYSTYASLKENNDTLHLLNLSHKLYQLNFLQMYPKTEIYNKAVKDGLYIDKGNNIDEYTFADPIVDKLAKYLQSDVTQNKYIIPVMAAIKDIGRLEKFLYIMKRDAAFRCDESMLNIINKAIDDKNNMCLKFDPLIYTFIDSCIELFFNKADQFKIQKNTENFINQCYESNVIKNIEKFRLSLVKTCLNHDRYTTSKFLKIRQL